MTEQEWLTCDDPREIIFHRYMPAKALRLFSVACCLRLKSLLSDRRSLALLETIEHFAYGRRSIEQWESANRAAADAVEDLKAKFDYERGIPEVSAAQTVLQSADKTVSHGAEFACYGAAFLVSGDDGEESPKVKKELKLQLDGLRKLVGKPEHLAIDRAACEKAWRSMPHRRLRTPPHIKIYDWFQMDPHGNPVFVDISWATLAEDPLRFSDQFWRASDQCPVCGKDTFGQARIPATLHSRSWDERAFDNKVWAHAACFAPLPEAGEPPPIPIGI